MMSQDKDNRTYRMASRDDLVIIDDKWPSTAVKKVFPSPAEMSLIKLSLAGNNKIIPGQGKFGK
jgi:hypothetical protein